jgi:hypothetical protein
MRGRSLPLSRPRRLITDLMHFAAGVPTVPVQRRMALGPLVAARRGCPDRPAWVAIFAKAFALVAAEFPEMRRAYCKLPWPHLYEYPATVANVMVERDYRGEKAVLGLRIKDPARRTLDDLDGRVQHAATVPIENIRCFRAMLRWAAVPRPLRRLAWWLALNLGRHRAKSFGTFAVTVYSALGAESLHPLSPLTATLNFGMIAPDGAVDVRLIYDHRVTDGATVARVLVRLEEVLNTAVRDELAGLVPYRHAWAWYHPLKAAG